MWGESQEEQRNEPKGAPPTSSLVSNLFYGNKPQKKTPITATKPLRATATVKKNVGLPAVEKRKMGETVATKMKDELQLMKEYQMRTNLEKPSNETKILRGEQTESDITKEREELFQQAYEKMKVGSIILSSLILVTWWRITVLPWREPKNSRREQEISEDENRAASFSTPIATRNRTYLVVAVNRSQQQLEHRKQAELAAVFALKEEEEKKLRKEKRILNNKTRENYTERK
jgi:hypothetical protein